MDDVRILTINAGSSSLRLALFERRAGEIACLHKLHYQDADSGPAPLQELMGQASGRIDLVAHRIVHGGDYTRPSRIDAAVEREIKRCAPLAPLHNPFALRWLDACRGILGESVPQVAVFDTAFYAELPQVAASYALPDDVSRAHGLRRYGFHGIAHQAMWRAWRGFHPELPDGGRIITLQLGAGCSMTAIARGRAVDTSMGFTPLEGLMMATRSGDVDPGILIYLQRTTGMDGDALQHMLMHRSGLAGVSGIIGGDMRVLLASDDARARLAIAMFCYRARKYIGSYLAALGGAEGILFGGGIGEHSAEIRRRIVEGLDELGIVLDARRNEAAAGTSACISAPGSRIELRVQPVDEARVLVEEALAVV